MTFGIKTKILLTMLLVGFIPGIVGSISTYLKGSQIFQESVVEKMQQLSRQFSFSFEELIMKEVSVARFISADKSLFELVEKLENTIPADKSGLEFYFRELMEREPYMRTYVSIAIHDEKGDLLYHYGSEKIGAVSSQSLSLLVKGGNKVVISDFYEDNNKSYCLPVHMPIYDSRINKAKRFITIQMNVEKLFSRVAGKFRLGDTGSLNLVSSGGLVFYNSLNSGARDSFNASIMNNVGNGNRPWFIGTDENGVDQIVAFSPLNISDNKNLLLANNQPLYVVLTQYKKEALGSPVRKVLLSATIPGFLLASLLILFIYLTLKKIVEPISVLKEGASIIGSGNLNHRIDIRTGDEIETLAQEFNNMAEELKELYSGLEEKVKERTIDLEESNRQLHEANRLKSEFLANMSHELRTPLNSIIGFSEVLYDGIAGNINERQKKYLDNIHKSGHHLLELINDLLNLSKIEVGKMELIFSEFSLNAALMEAKNIIAPLASKKKISVSVTIEKGLETIAADRIKLKQILYNILGNSIKFTPEEGSVEVRVKKIDYAFEFSVKDTGIGIKGDDINLIFESFRQVDGSHSRDYEGTGLGLSITKKFVEMHGGKIWVESEAGAGSTFFFTIPLPNLFPGDLDDASLEDIKPPTYSEYKSGVVDKVEKKMILIVEDNEESSELISMYLTEEGYDVAKAFDGENALAMAKELKPFAITLDIMLPRKDGWQILKDLKEDKKTAKIPVIIISMVEDQDLAYLLGAFETFNKPVTKKALLSVLERYSYIHKMLSTDMTILTVDDDPDCLELLSSILEPEGFNVITATGGKEAIDLAISRKPNLIILDLIMPEINGFDVVHALKATKNTENIPIIVLTAKEMTDEGIKLLSGHVEMLLDKTTLSKDVLLAELKSIEKKFVIPNSEQV